MLTLSQLSLSCVIILSFSTCVSCLDSHGSFEFACGELLEAGEGFIESPLFPDLYPPQVDCSWTITSRSGSRIRVKSEYFSIEQQPECLWDYLIIADGTEGKFGQAVYCGSEELDFLSTSNTVSILFHTDISGSDIGFRLKYEALSPPLADGASCDVKLTEEGNVTSPGYPERYPPATVCVYNIEAPADLQIKLTFTDFYIETAPCDFDKLEIYDGNIISDNGLLGIFCGRDLPLALTSETNAMTLKFVSDESIQSKGFSASVEFITRVEEASVASSSPSSPPTTTTTTKSYSETAVTDDHSSTLLPDSPATGNNRTEMLGEGCNRIITTANVSSLGFPHQISSPGFPENYPHDVTCVTKLRSDVLSTFLLQFVNFSMEEGENCAYDSLTIYEVGQGNSSSVNLNSTLLRRLCGNNLDDPIVSSEGYGLDLIFHSDMSVNDVGFLANVVIAPLTQDASCPAVCENGGSCIEILLEDGSVDWRCQCPEFYTGTLCDQRVRETCEHVQCQNDGVCRDDGTSVTCACPNGYTGRLCEELEEMPHEEALYFTKMASNMSLSLGSSVILECAVNDPTAHVMWLFQDRIMTNADWSRGVEVHPGGVVVIPEVKDEHSGRYTCMAITSGDLVERSLWLELTEPCSLYVSKSPSNMTVREGQAAMFQCYVPDADVTLWRKDGDIIKQGPRKRILVNHYLVINPVMETDIGEYTCSARAKSGCFAQVSAYLTVETTGHGEACGRPRTKPHETGTGRISSGREAPLGSAPWHAILREDKKDTTFCGGSLISPDTVLTAAHCIGQFEQTFGYPFHPRHIQIYLGTHHCAGHHGVYRQVKSYLVHEQFNDTHYNNDLALFKLDQPVHFNDDVMPICLETPEFLDELLTSGKLGVVTGCGGRVAHGRVPAKLHEVQIPYVSRDICRERASAVNTTFTPGMFCAGYARSMRGDACAGDSGGPYVLEFSGRSIQAGIVSWGVGCDRENHYGYYTSLSHYYHWIMDHLEQE